MTPIIQHKSQITCVSSRTHITAQSASLLFLLCFLAAQMRLGNSSYSPTIAGLVLEHLCPAIQNILEDGLRDHKLDFIIGQRRNHSWSVVEISTTMGICSFKPKRNSFRPGRQSLSERPAVGQAVWSSWCF
uniref:RUN domain-containing protein n=1 Tax=Poecilia latipinna TaxID=48699 RepID=A0A3B3VWU1_9TELE